MSTFTTIHNMGELAKLKGGDFVQLTPEFAQRHIKLDMQTRLERPKDDDETEKANSESIEREGVRIPLIISPATGDSAESVHLLAGYGRFDKWQRANLKRAEKNLEPYPLPVMLARSNSTKGWILTGLSDNNHARMTPSDMAHAVALAKQAGAKQGEIAAALGVQASRISQLEALNDAPAVLKYAVHHGVSEAIMRLELKRKNKEKIALKNLAPEAIERILTMATDEARTRSLKTETVTPTAKEVAKAFATFMEEIDTPSPVPNENGQVPATAEAVSNPQLPNGPPAGEGEEPEGEGEGVLETGTTPAAPGVAAAGGTAGTLTPSPRVQSTSDVVAWAEGVAKAEESDRDLPLYQFLKTFVAWVKGEQWDSIFPSKGDVSKRIRDVYDFVGDGDISRIRAHAAIEITKMLRENAGANIVGVDVDGEGTFVPVLKPASGKLATMAKTAKK